MTNPLVFHANLPSPDVKRLAELEVLAQQTNARFYTFEITPGGITISYHRDKILNLRLSTGQGVSFEEVLDESLARLRQHVMGHRGI